MTDISTTSNTATVDVKSAWMSKINWTQAVGVGATVLALASMNKIQVPVEQQATIVAVIQGVSSLATWIIKTWFTTTVTAASAAPKATP